MGSHLPSLLTRRMVLAGGLMLPGIALAARVAPPDATVNEAAIHWPIGGGRELHGFMAIPARARGRQPAIMVISGPDTPDTVARALVRSVAQAGFVTCALNNASFQPDTFVADIRATTAWLANGRYGTGRLGAIGAGQQAATAALLAGDGTFTAAVTLDDRRPAGSPTVLALRTEATGWSLSSARPAATVLLPDWAQAWAQAMAFLRGHLT